MSIRSDAVGQRVRVYWADEDEWFAGQVQDADEAQGYFVLDDDGDERWESLAQRVEFEEQQQQQQRPYEGEESGDDGEEQDTQELQEQQRTGGRAPGMMEPPASPKYDDAYDDDDDDDGDHHGEYSEEDDTQRHEVKREQDAGGEGGDGSTSERDGDGDEEDIEKINLATAGIAQPALRLQEDDDNDSDTNESEGHEADSDDDGEQSVAMSEVPITFERIASDRNSARNSAQPLTSRSSNSNSSSRSIVNCTPNAGVNLPVRGVLRGKVLRASRLPSIPATSQKPGTRKLVNPPQAFVKVAFVEAAAGENPKHTNVTLRCKNALASTSVAMQSNRPVWDDDDSRGGAEADGAFQMQLVPPTGSPKEPPAWLQLRGDVLFSVYSVSTNDSGADTDEEEKTERGRRRQVHDFVGQAVLSLKEILRHVLFGGSMSVTRQLPLQSQQGKPLGVQSSSRARSAIGDEDDDEEASVVMAPEIVVSFDFEPTYLEDTRQKVTRSRPTSQSTRSLAKDRGPTAPARSLVPQPKSRDQYSKQQVKAQSKPTPQAKKTTHTSSSTINRRKFEKQVGQQNVAFAKRLEWRDQRRARLSEHAKAQAKSKQPIPQHGTMKLDHKASSNINRTKFQQQVRQENRAMEKRLHAIIVKDTAEKEQHQQYKRGGGAKDHNGVLEFSDVGFDDLDKDKVLACDRRHHKLREQDFLMARAHAKYQQQNQVVEEVMKLQGELAELKTQVFNAKAAGSNPSSSPSAACEYLEKKTERQKLKLEQLEQEQSHFQREYELLLVSGEQETLRRQVHELQQTLFLCQARQKHARMAQQKHAQFADEKLAMEFQARVFQEQTETEILFKKKAKQ